MKMLTQDQAKARIAELRVAMGQLDAEPSTDTKTMSLEARTAATRAGVALTAEEETFLTRHGVNPIAGTKAKILEAIRKASQQL